jgi:hypothetical protein
MASTLIGVYDDYAHAEQALNDLLAHRFHRGDVQISPVEATPFGRQAALRALDQADDQSSNSVSLAEYFRTLFGANQDNSNVDIYLEAVRRGAYLLIVDAKTDRERDQAREIMSRFHPVDIDERSAQWRSRGWSKYDTSMPLFTDPEIEQERSLYTEERPSQSIPQVQGDTKSETANPFITGQVQARMNEAWQGSVRIFERPDRAY